MVLPVTDLDRQRTSGSDTATLADRTRQYPNSVCAAQAPDRDRIPRRVRQKVLQRLLIGLIQEGRHRLHQLTPPVNHQPRQVAGNPLLPTVRLNDQ